MANRHHAVRISLMMTPMDALFLKLSVTFDGLHDDIKFLFYHICIGSYSSSSNGTLHANVIFLFG